MMRTKSIAELVPIAEEIIGRLGGKFAIGIGPMRSGTTRSFTRNLQIFDHVYTWFTEPDRESSLPVFYQIAFEIDIHRIRSEKYVGDDEGFIQALFDEFYQSILTHPDLHVVLRMPDWEKSKGAQIEFKILSERQNPVRFIDIIPEDVPDLALLLQPETSDHHG